MKTFLLFSLIFLSSPIFSNVVQFDLIKEKSPVEFEAKGNPSLLSIKGLKGKGGGTLKFSNNSLSGNIIVALNDFDTDLDTRNEHMKEKYLETGKPGFDRAILKIDSNILQKDFFEKYKKLEKFPIEATLVLHGKEKKIICLTDLMIQENELTGKTNFKIKLSDFGIEVPSFAGITIEDEVVINAQFKGSTGKQ